MELKSITKGIFLACCLFFISPSYAILNPFTYTVSPNGGFPAQTTTGSTYQVNYTITNRLPHAVPYDIGTRYSGGSFHMSTDCNGHNLAPNSSCFVHLVLQPLVAGHYTANVIVKLGYDRYDLPTLTTTAASTKTTEKIDGIVTIPLPPVSFMGTNYPVEFTFTNDGTADLAAGSVVAVDVVGFVPDAPPVGHDCSQGILVNDYCTVSIANYTPPAVGEQTLSVTFRYNNGSTVKSVPLSTSTFVKNNVGPCHNMQGVPKLALPASTSVYSDHVVEFKFTNHCDANAETLGTVTITPSLANTQIIPGTDNCSGKTIAADASCSIFVAVDPTITGDLTVDASIPFNSGQQKAVASTFTVVGAIQSPTNKHNITFINQCPHAVWYGFANGNGQDGAAYYSPDPTPANARSTEDYKLNKRIDGQAPSTKTLTFDNYVNGVIFPRTKCSVDPVTKKLKCQTASCNTIVNNGQATGTCVVRGTVGDGAAPPYTKLESYMANTVNADGVYDVSAINGFSIPVEFKALHKIGTSNPFNCGSAGAIIQPSGSGLGAATWQFDPASTGDEPENYILVEAGAENATCAGCGAGEVCGTAFTSFNTFGGQAPIVRRCAKQIGYWTVAQFAGYKLSGQWGNSSPNLYNFYTLGTKLPSGPSCANPNNPVGYCGSWGTVGGKASSYADLYACNPTDQVPPKGSLYSGYTYDHNACGCYDWSKPGSVVPTALSPGWACQPHTSITDPNNLWGKDVFNRIKWLKKACPTCYSFQFDDPSSSFSCAIPEEKTSYEIVFCPGGKTGDPA